MTETTTNIEQTKNDQLFNVKGEEEQQDECQSSTSASNLNKSIDGLCPKNLGANLDFTEIIKEQYKRKLSAPISISQNMGLNITKLAKCPRNSYFNKLICKGLLC